MPGGKWLTEVAEEANIAAIFEAEL